MLQGFQHCWHLAPTLSSLANLDQSVVMRHTFSPARSDQPRLSPSSVEGRTLLAPAEAPPVRKEASSSKAPLQDDTAHGEHMPATALQVSAADQAPETRSKRGAKGRVQWAADGSGDAAA